MTTSVEVWVSVGGEDIRAGTLFSHRRRGRETASFIYDVSFLARPDGFPLDPALPLVTGTQTAPGDKTSFNAFSDAAPDRWGRRLIGRAEALRAEREGGAPRSLSEFELLLGVRDDLRQGAVRFRATTGGPFLAVSTEGVPALMDLPELLGAVARVERGRGSEEDVLRLLADGSSLGGARPKVHVRLGDGTLWIAKFPSKQIDGWDVPAWEHVTLRLARLAGLDTPRSELHAVAGRNVVIVERFDRDPAGRRIPYASALTMLEANDGDQASYLDIAEAIEEVSSAATDDLAELWRRICFTALVSNTDDHLRNHGFLHVRGTTWTLSPVFDVNPNPESRTLRTSIDEAQTTPSLEVLRLVAPMFRVDEDRIDTELRNLRRATRQWRRIAKESGIKPSEMSLMAPAFEHGLALMTDTL